MLAKIFLLIVIFLEILKVPQAQERVENWAISLFKKPLLEIKKIEIEIREIDLFAPPLPMKKEGVKEPLVLAEEAILIDIPTSKILLEKNSDKKIPVASLTKIMTALIVLENYKLSEVLTVLKEATEQKGAQIFLREGEKMTVENLLHGLLLYSGNDAAYTLASKMGQDDFVKKMNEKAKKLGLFKTHFVDPTGLNPKNVSTAKELGFLTIFALRNKTFSEIVQTDKIEIWSVDKSLKHSLLNTNKLLREYQGTYGVKTGYTEEAQHCLIAAVNREGHKVLSVLLNHPSDQFKETKMLLDWVYNSHQW